MTMIIQSTRFGPVSWTAASPYAAYNAEKGDYTEEYGLTKTAGANITLQRLATGWTGSKACWEFIGGNAGGEHALMTVASSLPMSGNEIWCGMRVIFDSWASISGKKLLCVAVTAGDAGQQAANKPEIAIDQTGKVYLIDSNNAANDTEITTLSLSTEYYLLLHARGGASGSLTHEVYVYNSNGNELAKGSKAWAVGNAGSSDVAKWGAGSTTDYTGLQYRMRDLVVFKDVSTNPGPCRVVTKRPSSATASGNWTAGVSSVYTAGGDVVTNITEVPNDGDSTYIRVLNATASQIEYDMTAASIGSNDTIHGLIAHARERHTGSTPTWQLGLKQTSSESLANMASVTAYNVRRNIITTDPATTVSWTPNGADTAKLIIRDHDTLSREILVTNAWCDVVSADNP